MMGKRQICTTYRSHFQHQTLLCRNCVPFQELEGLCCSNSKSIAFIKDDFYMFASNFAGVVQ